MLKQASVSDLISDRVNREKGYVVITMRRYPRFINRALRDEYLACLSPVAKLLEDFLTLKRASGDHNRAYTRAGFESKFIPIGEELEHLARLVELSKKQDVYFVCQCAIGYRCHREQNLILARELFNAKVDKVHNEYPVFMRKLEKLLPELKASLKTRKKTPIALASAKSLVAQPTVKKSAVTKPAVPKKSRGVRKVSAVPTPSRTPR